MLKVLLAEAKDSGFDLPSTQLKEMYSWSNTGLWMSMLIVRYRDGDDRGGDKVELSVGVCKNQVFEER